MAVGRDISRSAGNRMTKRTTITNTATRINIGNMIQKLRRIRNELAQMMQQVDDALARIDAEAKV